MWEFYGYYRNRNISDDEYINYSEKDIVGDSYVFFFHVMNCLNIWNFVYIQDGKLCITFPDNYMPVKPERWSGNKSFKGYIVYANI